MAIITVKSQAELDAIPIDTEDIIRIEFGTPSSPAVVRNRYKHPVEVHGNRSVRALEDSDVVAYENSFVVARRYGHVTARGNSYVVARENSSVKALENSYVVAYGDSSVIAGENSYVKASENTRVAAFGNSSVVARGYSHVEAHVNSLVVAYGGTSVIAGENSSVNAFDYSHVDAYDTSRVEAWDNSYVEAKGNAQVVDFLQGAIIRLSGNARAVYAPRNIEEFMNFYGIEHNKTTALFYKAVHKRKLNTLYADDKEVSSFSEYVSDYDEDFKYEIGKTVTSSEFDNNPQKDCGKGIHISYKSWALDYGRNWEDLALLEVRVEIKDILLPKHSNGKIRAPKVEVVREVPLEECGLFGKILLRRRKNNEV